MAHYFFGPDTYGARLALDELAASLSAHLHFLDRDTLEQANFADLLAQSKQGLFGQELLVVRDPSLCPKGLQEMLVEAHKKYGGMEWVAWDRVTPDKKTSLWKTFQKVKREFPHPAAGVMVGWLVSEAKTQGSVLDRAAGQELVARVGQDRWQLLQELKKLTAVHDSITIDHVRAAVVRAEAEANVFQMLDALVRGDGRQLWSSLPQRWPEASRNSAYWPSYPTSLKLFF